MTTGSLRKIRTPHDFALLGHRNVSSVWFVLVGWHKHIYILYKIIYIHTYIHKYMCTFSTIVHYYYVFFFYFRMCKLYDIHIYMTYMDRCLTSWILGNSRHVKIWPGRSAWDPMALLYMNLRCWLPRRDPQGIPGPMGWFL
jgi:hypothetical protein